MEKHIFLNGKLNLANPYATSVLDIRQNRILGITKLNVLMKNVVNVNFVLVFQPLT